MDVNALVCEFSPLIYRFALARTGNPDTAQDIAQETFLLLFEKKPKFDSQDALRVWLIRTAINVISNERKRHENVKTVSTDDTAELAWKDETLFELRDLLNALPKLLRECTLLYYIEDMPTKDLAKALGISRATVKVRLSRARDILSKIYKEELL